MDKYCVTYSGLFQELIVREFNSLERAEQWARQAGVYTSANIYKVSGSQGAYNNGVRDVLADTKTDKRCIN